MRSSFAVALLAASAAHGEVRFSSLYSDHMVLQRDHALRFNGAGQPGEEVTVELATQQRATKADAAGHWVVTLDPLPVSRGLILTARGPHNAVEIKDVAIGDVWLCSGQSNMGVPVIRALNGPAEAKAANYPDIRFFTLPTKASLQPLDEVNGAKWEPCVPPKSAYLSAVAYFYARGLYQDLKIPLGIIQSSVGGSPINGWISLPALEAIPEEHQVAEQGLAKLAAQPNDAREYPGKRAAWEKEHHVEPPPNEGFAKGWAAPDFDDHTWDTAAFPARWEDAAHVKSGGVFWLRKEVQFPAEQAGKTFSLVLNYMHGQYDTTYFNGVEVGRSGDEPPFFDMSQRRYDVPAKLVKPGKNAIAIRVVSASQRSDLMGRGAYGDYNLPLDRHVVGNRWKVHVESLFPPITYQDLRNRPRPNDASPQGTPTSLYNAMIHPLESYTIRGVIWYQGESNTRDPDHYAPLLSLLIKDWRHRWALGELPFYYVQLPNYMPAARDPNDDSHFAKLREQQSRALGLEPHTGMVVTIDVGEADNLHPINKQPVGERLARLALAETYGRNFAVSGPVYESMSLEPHRIRLHFQHAQGLKSSAGPLQRFAIAGADHHFVWADAVVDGETILVSSPSVPDPVAVRYAWADNPSGCNLTNDTGLPASPFRTDHWPH